MADQESKKIFTQTELDELEDLENWNLTNIEDGTKSDEPATSEIGDFKEEILESDIPCEHDELSTCSKCDIFTQLLSGPDDEMSNAESEPQDDVNVIHPFTCEVCSEKFVFRVHLLEHEKCHVSEILSCSLCDQKFRGHFDLTKHEREIHSEFQCSALSSEIAKPKLKSIEQIDENPKDVDQVSHKLSCSSCDKKFEDKWDLRKHEKKIHGYPLVCLECGNKFKRVFELKRHDDEVHNNVRTYECKQCDKSFSRKTSLRSHEKRRHKMKDGLEACLSQKSAITKEKPKLENLTKDPPYSCAVSEKKFKQAAHLESHQLSHTKEKPFSCSLCDKKFTKSFDLKRHEDARHKGLKPFKCRLPRCNKSFGRLYGLKSHEQRKHRISNNDGDVSHLAVNSDEKTFSCPECQRAYSYSADLKKHLKKVHTGLNPFNCSECDRSFGMMSCLKAHLKVHRKLDMKISTEKDKEKTNTDNGPFICLQCNKEFSTESYFRQHQKTNFHHSKINKNDGDKSFAQKSELAYQNIHPSQEKSFRSDEITNNEMTCEEVKTHISYSCSSCDEIFFDAWDLRLHQMKIHASPIVCIECGKKFKRPFELKRHEDEVHKNLRTFDCEVCGKSFPRKSSLKSHQQNVHEKEDKQKLKMGVDTKTVSEEVTYKLSCSNCNEKFKDEWDLRKHEIKIHACPIMCSKCGHTFQKACDLKRHEVEIHFNLRTYKCPLCYQSFNRKFSLKSHKLRIHNIKDELFNMKMDSKKTSEEVTYGCSSCDDKFINEWDLRKHKMKRHGSPIMCRICDQIFRRPPDLKRHEDEVHKNLRTFKCPSCDKSFTRKTSLKSHEKLHAKRQVTELWKPYACPKCDKRFTAEWLVKKHLIEIHMYWMGREKINPDFTEEKIELI